MAQKHVIKFSSIVTYFTDEKKLIERGENALESGDVLKMYHDDTSKTISGTVRASMKDKTYKVEVYLDDDKSIVKTKCTCPRGQFTCHHAAALMLFAHYNLSVTDQSCSWSAPKTTVQETVQSIDELYPVKRPYRASKQDISDEAIENLREQLSSFGGAVGFTWLLTPNIMPQKNKIIINVSDVIFSLDYQNADNKNAYFIENMRISKEKILEVAEKTTGQSRNPLWLTIKNLRLTASSFDKVLTACKRNRFPPSLFKQLKGSYNLDGIRAVQWGREHEEAAVEAFTATTGLLVTPTGLWLHSCGYLGASPDGLVGDNAILEVKCPFKFRDRNLMEELSKNNSYICLYNVETFKFEVNKNHEYYSQIQGQMHILNKELCYLVIWTPSTTIVLKVPKEESWKDNLIVLQNFYINKFLTHLLQP